jgi:hypothetical protein
MAVVALITGAAPAGEYSLQPLSFGDQASEYVVIGKPLSYWHVVESARRRGHVTIGFRIASASNDASTRYGVSVNPPKDTVITFTADDRVIVIAED